MENKVNINVLKTASEFKVLDISGNPGDSLKNHKVDNSALLLVRAGSIIYKEAERMVVLSAGEACDIPANVFHKVTCTTKAKFFVVLSNQAKMTFEK